MAQIFMPTPMGDYKVGTTVFDVIDTARTEKLGPEAGTALRKVSVRLYYPVLVQTVVGMDKAVAMSAAKMKALCKFYHMPVKNIEDSEGEFYQDVEPVPGKKFPLIIFGHGLGSYRESNNLMLTELASRGYVVAAIGHTYEEVLTEFADGTTASFDKRCQNDQYQPKMKGTIEALKIMMNKNGNFEEQYARFNAFQNQYCGFLIERMEERAKDVRMVLDEIKRRFADIINLERGVGISGHSIGGSTAYYVCMHDDEFTCGLNLDGMLLGHYENMRMKKPFYQISCEDARTTVSRVALDADAPVYWELFNGMKHIGFADMIFMVPIKSVVGKMDPMKYHEYVCKIHQSMFDTCLKCAPFEVFTPDDGYVRKLV
ncbi:MAG: hypothetical protein IK142_05500 [Clostridiales bacterium]|nr:hypothetical protein [Clostridiales bacterium]